jgi:alkanesulfonate monooxygenase SsuD/methylene tetrahydromethanopterin reductase-like flavin-dependent oxidoreductase (luciferase family)
VTGAPFAPGSVSLRLYPHGDLPATAIVDELVAQATLGAAHGFDGVMTSEHHAGFQGYLPNPLQAAGWCLEEMRSGWAAPAPLLLPLRPAALVAEEIAWLAARFPGRVGLGVASGALARDFEVMGLEMRDLAGTFATALERVVGLLDASIPDLEGDPAIAAVQARPVPVVSAAMGLTAVRRAARLGVGVLFDSMSTPDRCRALVDAYHDAGGAKSRVLIRRAWLGEPPRGRLDAQLDVYRSYTPASAQVQWGRDEVVASSDPTEVVDALADVCARAGTDALNLRIHVPGVAPAEAREQIEALGADVVGPLRARLTRDSH